MTSYFAYLWNNEFNSKVPGWKLEMADLPKGKISECDHNMKIITVDKQYWYLEKEYVRNALAHEIAHSLLPIESQISDLKHGDKWKQLCISLGGSGNEIEAFDSIKDCEFIKRLNKKKRDANEYTDEADKKYQLVVLEEMISEGHSPADLFKLYMELFYAN